MSIALSAVVRPSRMARCVLSGWALAQWAAAAMVLAAPARFAAPAWLAATFTLAGLALACAAARPPKTHRIDISGTGELRVTVQQNVRAATWFAPLAPLARVPDAALTVATRSAAAAAAASPRVAASVPAASARPLLPGSVRWPGLIVLRLGPGVDADADADADAEDVLPCVVPIWRDGVDGDTWRALAVAVAVIGKPSGQDDGFEKHR